MSYLSCHIFHGRHGIQKSPSFPKPLCHMVMSYLSSPACHGPMWDIRVPKTSPKKGKECAKGRIRLGNKENTTRRKKEMTSSDQRHNEQYAADPALFDILLRALMLVEEA